MSYIGNAPVFPTESVLPGNLQVTGNATINGTTNSVGALTENGNAALVVDKTSQPLDISSSAGNGSITVDSSGRITAPNRVMFYARISSGSGDRTGVYTAIFNTKIFDVGNGFNTSTGVYTAPVTGNYYFSICAFNDSGNFGRIDWIKNTSSVVGRFGREYTGGYFPLEASIVIDMAANDTIQGNVTSGNMHYSAAYNYFSGFLIG